MADIRSSRRRAQDRSQLKPFFPYLKLLLTALYRLPMRSRHVYRGIRGKFSTQYKVGSVHMWWPLTSTTSIVTEVDKFLGGNVERTLFSINALAAIDVAEYSNFPSEKECLILPSSFFQVWTDCFLLKSP